MGDSVSAGGVGCCGTHSSLRSSSHGCDQLPAMVAAVRGGAAGKRTGAARGVLLSRGTYIGSGQRALRRAQGGRGRHGLRRAAAETLAARNNSCWQLNEYKRSGCACVPAAARMQ